MKKNIIVGLLVMTVCLISVFGIAPRASKPEMYRRTIQKLDEKQKRVLEMTATAAGASLALAMVPGDATTPIANKVIDMAGYFVIILSVIVLEKYMLTLAGYLTFTWLIPIAAILLVVWYYSGKKIFSRIGWRILAFGLLICLIVPVSVRVTEIIEKTNEESINNTMESMKEIEKEAEATTQEKIPDTDEGKSNASGPLGLIDDVRSKLNDLAEDSKEAIDQATSTVTQLTKEKIEDVKDTLNDFVEVVVIMLVTTCGIPVITIVVLVWIIKMLLGVGYDFPSPRKE